jgi:hypothetical protein
MKNYQKGIYVLLFSCGCLNLAAQENSSAKSGTIRLINKLAVARKDELLELDRSFIEKKLGQKVSPNGIKFVGDGAPVTLQFDDLDGNGEWDKLVFLLSFAPKQTLLLQIADAGGNDVTIVNKAHVRHKRKLSDDTFGPSLKLDSIPAGQPNTDFNKDKLPPFLTEGPAWENDKVGFRIYLDVRNTKDIWGKTTSAMVLDEVGADPSVIYHHLAPWGMDILAVGKSLGAGSLAMSVPVPGKADTLVRLGGKNMGKVIYHQVADGPVRAVFQMEYPEWNVLGDGRLTSVTEQISIWGGQYFYESKVFVKDAPKGATLVTGIVNLKSHNSLVMSSGTAKILYTFDQQSENKDNLGMAILAGKKDLLSFSKTPNVNSEVLNTYTAKLKLPSARSATAFRYYACWEKSDQRFANEESFKTFLTNEAENFNSAIAVK